MKYLIATIAFLFLLSAKGQGRLHNLFEELPNDSIAHNSVQSHTSLKPRIDYSPSVEKKIAVHALADINGSYDTTHSLRSGLGLNLDWTPNQKWHIRLAALQGYGLGSAVLQPKSFLRFNDSDGYAYTDIRSRISYTPNRFFNFQAGLDHNFLGEGCRSLLLSDYGTSSPFALIRTHFWRVEYNVLYNFYREGNPGNWESKFAATHHLSINPAKWLNIGVFESVTFQPIDTNLRRGFDAEYLNPIIFYRPQEYALGSSDNVIMGLDLSARFKAHTIYGQFVIDEFSLTELRAKSGWWANKFGGQLGIKGRLMQNNLFYRVEYNFMRPYTFSHVSEDLNYGNQGSPIGHPYGANFMEILGELKYQRNKWIAKFFTSYMLTGSNKDSYAYGADIYDSYVLRPNEYGNFIGQGIQQNRAKVVVSCAYQILKHGKLNAFIENHLDYNAQEGTMGYRIIGGLRSFLWNDYRNY